MREPVTSEDLDDLSAAAVRSPGSGHREGAEQLRRWAEDPHPMDVAGPRALLVEAGELLELGGDLDAALTTYRRAAALPGPVDLDPRCFIVRLLHERGEHEQADGVEQELRRSRPRSAATYELMGELSAGRGETTRALGWFNRGISLAEDEGLVEAEMGGLCLARWRLRERLGHDPDQFDEFGMDYRERVRRAAQRG